MMNPTQTRPRAPTQIVRSPITLICAVLILLVGAGSWAMQTQQASPSAGQQAPTSTSKQAPASASQNEKLSNDQLDSLVAQIALYPDPLLSQTLVACTYPLEIVQLQQFLEKHKDLKDKALTDAVAKQSWDPSVQAMAAFPTLVKQLADNIAWTDNLGNAFLAQQNDVMDAVQRMRKKAVDKGALKSTEEQKVETKVVESKTVVVVQPTSPEVVYVPSYAPYAVWGAPYYPYPVMAYPWYAPTGGRLLAFGTGVAIGAAWGGGGWGWNTGWGGNNDININRNNTFVRNYNGTGGNRYGGANNSWRHNPQHRGGAPYGNRATAQQYGGAARGDNMGQRQAAARQNQANSGGPGKSFSGGGLSNTRGASAQSGNMGGGGDRVGNRQTSNGSMGSKNSSAFSGSSGSAARASSSRGASSMGSRGGGARMGGGRRR